MSFLVFLTLLLLTLLLFWKNKPAFAKKSTVATLAGLFLVGQGWVPLVLLKGLQIHSRLVQVNWLQNNVIVVLGAGATEWKPDQVWTAPATGMSRISEGARLFYQCQQAKAQCSILASGGDPKKRKITEAQLIQRGLMALGVPESAILLETKSGNTLENAQFSADLIKDKKFERIVLVTSGFHLARAQKDFSHFQIEAMAAPSDRLSVAISLFPLAQHFAFTDIAINEYLGFLRFQFYQWLGGSFL